MMPREMKIVYNRTTSGPVSDFIHRNYFHFNAGVVKDATEAYARFVKNNGKILLAMAGAASTSQIGISLANMIREDKVHAISCTGANLEEDLFNLVANKDYVNLSKYQNLSLDDETELLNNHINRVTDVGIPEKQAMTPIEDAIISLWEWASGINLSFYPYEYLYKIIKSGKLKKYYQIDPKDSWMVAAAEKNLPIVTPGWEDSTLGQVFSALVKKEKVNPYCVKSGVLAMGFLIDWYKKNQKEHEMGFFQLGGGIAGDFSICVVPVIEQDMKESVKKFRYFCQIRDAPVEDGGYSGAPGKEKITWGKLDKRTEMFDIVHDFTVVAPLMFDAICGL